MKCFLYILYSEILNTYYTGITSNLEIHLLSHNELGNDWTASGRPWNLLFSKEFPDRSTAQKWESWIKKQKSIRMIKKIIDGDFDWQ